MDQKDETIAALREALAFYADPGTYHAMSIIGDRPCGTFANDFSKDHQDFDRFGGVEYERAMPGALARRVLRASDSGVRCELKCDIHHTQLVIEPQVFCQECTDEMLLSCKK